MMVMGCERETISDEALFGEGGTHLAATETFDVSSELGSAVEDDGKLDRVEEGGEPFVVFYTKSAEVGESAFSLALTLLSWLGRSSTHH
jgi:hypothetical protein